VYYQGHPIGGDPGQLVNKPWCRPVSIRLTRAQKREIETALSVPVSGPVEISLIPLDLTRSSPSPDCKGQIILAQVTNRELPALLPILHTAYGYFSLAVRLDDDRHLCLTLEYYDPTHTRGVHRSASVHSSVDISRLLRLLPLHARRMIEDSVDLGVSASYNGIPSGAFVLASSWSSNDDLAHCVFLMMTLSDSMRPSFSLSRDEIRSMPEGPQSILHLALLRALRRANIP
jgi:hypothetical protein